MTMSSFKLKGLVAAPFTPFHENGDLNLSLVDQYIESLLSDGVKSVFICGTTGEGPNMTLEERKLVAEKWVTAGQNKLDAIVVHVGCGNLRETIELAKHAEEIKASAIATIPSVFFKPQTIDQLVDYLREVSLAAPEIPLYYYHIPGMTGVNFPMFDFMGIASDRLPNLAGIKCSHIDTLDVMRCQQEFGSEYQFCNGNDPFQCLILWESPVTDCRIWQTSNVPIIDTLDVMRCQQEFGSEYQFCNGNDPCHMMKSATEIPMGRRTFYCSIAVDELLEAAQGKVPTLRGVKYSDPDLITFGHACQRFGDQFQMCFSKDELLLPSLTFGIEAFVGSTYNYVGKPCNRVLEAYKRKDMEAAQKEQFKFLAMVKVLFKYDLNVATQKAVMGLTRLDLGPTRAPVPNLSAEQKEALKKDLTDMGYFDWTK